MIKFFDETAYLEANPDLECRLEDLHIYLDKSGINDMEKGLRRFHPDYEPFDETLYLQTFTSVRDGVEEGIYISGFDHFLQFGYEEILKEERSWQSTASQKNHVIRKVIAVVGIPRSGLTLTEALLGSHSQITPWFLPYATRKDFGIEPFTDSDSIQEQYAQAFGGERIDTDTVAISISTNDDSIDFLTKSFDNLSEKGIETKIIWIVRNINHAYISQMEAAEQYWNAPENNINLESYQQYITFAKRGYDQLVELVRHRNHVICSFSNLLNDPNNTIAHILKFVQIPFEEFSEFYSRINHQRVAGDPGFFTHDTVVKDRDMKRFQEWKICNYLIGSLDVISNIFVFKYNILVNKVSFYDSSTLEMCTSNENQQFDLTSSENSKVEINGFDEQAYLRANQDIEILIHDNTLKNALEYLQAGGLEEIEKGLRKFHYDFEPYNESLYLESFPDIREAVEEAIEQGILKTGFHHFYANGYREIVEYNRSWPEVYHENLIDNKEDSIIEHQNYYNYCKENNVKSIDIILPVYNALEDVEKCIESLYKYNSYPFKLIVVDDCSDAETEVYLKKELKDKKYKLIRNKENLRFTKSVNRGFENSEADYVILLNSDTIVTKNWIEKIIACFESNAEFGIVGPLSNAASWQTVPVRDNPAGGWLVNEIPDKYNVDKMGLLVEVVSKKRYPEVPSVNGFCYAIRREVIETIGILDVDYFPTGYGEEDDFSLRARNHGFKIAVVDDAYIFHAKSKSYSHETRKIFSKNGRISLDKKHGKEKIEELISDWKNEKILPNIAKNIQSCMHISKKNKKVVYTAIFGNYDDLKDPEYVNKDWDYICFTDNKNIKSNIYTVKYVDPIFSKSVRNARMIKILPHLFLIGYDYSLWIDGSVRLRGRNITNIIKEMNHKNNYIFLHEHIVRDCVYDEGMACILMGKDNDQDIILQLKNYKNLAYPDKNGLVETAEILRDHQNKNVELLNEEWWNILNQHSFRDQLSFNFAIWKNNLNYGKMNGVQWQDQYFKMLKHGNSSGQSPKLPTLTILFFMGKETIEDVETIVLNLLKKTIYVPKFDVLVVDYDCVLSEEAHQRVSSLTKRLNIIKPKANNSKLGVLNYCVKKIKSEYFSIIDDDIKIMSKDWLSILSNTLYENKKCAIVAPSIFDYDFIMEPNIIKVIGRRDNETLEYEEKVNIGGKGSVSAVNPSCALIKTSIFKELGGLDEKSTNVLISFVDFCEKCNNNGYEVHLNSDSEVASKRMILSSEVL